LPAMILNLFINCTNWVKYFSAFAGLLSDSPCSQIIPLNVPDYCASFNRNSISSKGCVFVALS
jgi:hypothetical protein